MRRLRVLQLVSGVAVGDQSGGAELFALQLARHLPREEFEPAVFAMWRYSSPAEREWLARLADDGIPVCGLVEPAGPLAGDLARVSRALWQTVGALRPAVVGSHSERGDTLNAALRWLHPVHPRAVRTMHTDQQWQRRPWAGALLSQAVFPLAFDAEVAISQAVCDALNGRPLARLLRRPAVLCYNGVDAALFERPASGDPAAPRPAGVPDARPRLGVVGRLAPQKGHADLLVAMQRIVSVVPASLLIVGAGPLEADLRKLAGELGIGGAVHFLGSRRDALDVLGCLDLLVSSSRWEGFPTVLLEAMALGVPVVATDVSGSRELVTDGVTGRLVPPGRPDRLAQAILAALAEPAATRACAAAARARAGGFTIQDAARQYASLYRRLADSDAGSPGRGG